MGRPENFKQYAADCVAQAEGAQSPEDKNILLNMALAWVRLAHQTQTIEDAPAGGEVPAAEVTELAAEADAEPSS